MVNDTASNVDSLVEESTFALSPEEYEWLEGTMDESTPAPRLREALDQKPIWDA